MPDRDSQDAEKRKRGRVEVRGGQPLAFIEDSTAGDIAPEPPAELREAASQVITTLKAYRDAVKSLLSGKYADLRDFTPNHLREPCDIAAICCRNGIIVRYDLGKEGATKIRGGAIDDTLSELAPKFSDSLLHFPLDRATYDPGQAGIKLEMEKVNFQTGEKEPISTIQLVMIGSLQFDPSVSIPPPPSRPPCLVSLTNELQLVMSGVVVPADPKSAGNIDKTREFLAQSTIRLQVGWQALEVYPAFQAEYWKPEFAPLWAESDLLAAVARHQFSRAQLAAIDPNLAARRAFKAILDELAQLLDGPEEPAHQFLKQHPEIISPTHTAAWSKLPLGNRVTDFVFREPSNDYLLVEIESPLRELFRKDGQQREELTHAFNQIIDWRIFIENNLQKVQEEIGLVGMSANPRSLIVIGRSSSLTEENRRKLATLQGQIPRLRILTYDELIQTSKALAENLFGPLDITGENVEILYPLPKTGAT
jgi:hypothetical protein